ncbi:MAG: hypothetical protein IPK67_07970 [Planctomycetes bacterium]|nr:hypothetical protein [Planctomycetota bacterium]
MWGIVELWDSVKGVRLEHLEHGVKPIAAIDFNADGTLLAAGTWDGDVALWTVGGWGEARRLFAPKNDDYQAVRDLAFAPPGPAGDELAVSYADGRARLYDARTLALLRTLDTTAPGVAKGELNDLCYLPDGARLATVGADLTLRLWERASGKLLSEYAGHTRSVQSVAAHPGGKLLFTGAADGSVRTWDLRPLEPARSIWRGPSTSYSLALSPDGLARRDHGLGRLRPHRRGRDRPGTRALGRPRDLWSRRGLERRWTLPRHHRQRRTHRALGRRDAGRVEGPRRPRRSGARDGVLA